MGAGISSWRLARAVAQVRQLGVVSGTALDVILARRLQDGDPGGHMRRGLDHFPDAAMAERVWQTYYVAGGKAAHQPYKPVAMQSDRSPRAVHELCIVANFVEVYLAREGHEGPVGINYLEKVRLPHLPSIYGAMLAGVEYVLMGAGIPLKIPGVLDAYVHHEAATYPLYVAGSQEGDDCVLRFTPRDFLARELPPLRRPKFLAIIASNTLAVTMVKKANGRVDGFVIEGPTAGGHNAPPRGKPQLDAAGEPIYGERDRVDLERLRELGLPFWLAVGYGTPERVTEALAAGAAGVQVGTAFAFCAESALRDDYKYALLQRAQHGEAKVFTDPVASPTGFPFKVAQLPGTLSEDAVYQKRARVCDLGFLREAYRTAGGDIAFRCPGEPLATYLAKGGSELQTHGRKCLCNALVANLGQGQLRHDDSLERGLVTSGDDLVNVPAFLAPGAKSYSAADVLARLLAGVAAQTTELLQTA